MFQEDFSGRCLPFDFEAAKDYALIMAERNRPGSPISVEDDPLDLRIFMF